MATAPALGAAQPTGVVHAPAELLDTGTLKKKGLDRRRVAFGRRGKTSLSPSDCRSLICIKCARGAACFLSKVRGADRRRDRSRHSRVTSNIAREAMVHGLDNFAFDRFVGGRRATGAFVAAAVAISALLPPLAGAEEALSPPAQRGLVFVRTHCAKCHAIDRVSQSPLPAAPPFRRYTNAIQSRRCRSRWLKALSPAILRCRSSSSTRVKLTT